MSNKKTIFIIIGVVGLIMLIPILLLIVGILGWGFYSMGVTQ